LNESTRNNKLRKGAFLRTTKKEVKGVGNLGREKGPRKEVFVKGFEGDKGELVGVRGGTARRRRLSGKGEGVQGFVLF